MAVAKDERIVGHVPKKGFLEFVGGFFGEEGCLPALLQDKDATHNLLLGVSNGLKSANFVIWLPFMKYMKISKPWK